MVIEYIRYESSRPDALLAAYGEARSALDGSPHCLAYELAHCVEDPTVFILRIEWDSSEGHMEGFRKSAAFKEFFAAVRPFVGDIREMRHYAQTPISTRKD